MILFLVSLLAVADAIHAPDSHSLRGCPQYWTPAESDCWVGDVVLGTFDGRVHVFYLKDRHHHMSAEGMGCHFFAHLSATTTLTDWMEHPDAVPLTEWWQTLGTGTPFVKDGKLCLAYGYHSERVDNWKELKLPAGATWAESDDAVHFRPTGVIFHETRNPTVYNRPDGRFGMILGYGGMGGMFASDDLLKWEPVDEKLPGRGDCPCYFTWNGHHYLVQGFTQMFHSASGNPGTWEDWGRPGDDIYEGLSVPMVCEVVGGRRLMAGWLRHPKGWGGWLVFRELKQEADGKLALCWPTGLSTPVARPDIHRFDANSDGIISYRTVQGHKKLKLVIDAKTKTAAWTSGKERKDPYFADDFVIRNVQGLDRPYVVKVSVWYDERHDVTIFDAEIAGRRTLITRRYGRYEKD